MEKKRRGRPRKSEVVVNTALETNTKEEVKVNDAKEEIAMTKEATTQTTAVAVKEESKALATALVIFKDIDFEGLNGVIDKLGDNSKELSIEERKAATEVIQEWQHTIITRLDNKYCEVSAVLRFFGKEPATRRYYYGNPREAFTDAQKAILAAQTGTEALYEKLEQAIVAVQDKEIERPEMYIEDPDMSFNANLLARKDYEKLLMLFNMELDKLQRAVVKAEIAWKKALIKNEKVKELIKTTEEYYSNIDTLKGDCANKANLAKLGINVSSKETRDALKELLAFSRTI